MVEALLKKYADVDVPGKDRKTAIYIAVEKGYVAIVKMLLNANPDLEIATRVKIKIFGFEDWSFKRNFFKFLFFRMAILHF